MEKEDKNEFVSMNISDTNTTEYESLDQCSKSKIRNIWLKLCICFLCLIISFLIIGICLYGSNDEYIIEINNSINNLSKIEDDKDRIMEIMTIDDKVNNISKINRLKIHRDLLSENTIETINSLKSSVEWNKYMCTETNYISLDSIASLNLVNDCTFEKGINNPRSECKLDEDQINKFYNLVYLPYISLNDPDNMIDYEYGEILNNDSFNFFKAKITFNEDNLKEIEIDIYDSGYVLIKEIDYEKITNKYISLINLDYNKFRIYYGAFDDDENFYFYEKISSDDIEYITILDHGMATSTIKHKYGDEMVEYYDKNLKNLHFIKDTSETNDFFADGNTISCGQIVVQLKNTENMSNIITIYVDRKNNETVLSSGLMVYFEESNN